jgi:hypothetical protein
MIHLGMSSDPPPPASSDRPVRYLGFLHVGSVVLVQMLLLPVGIIISSSDRSALVASAVPPLSFYPSFH